MARTLLVLGATGFLGAQVCSAARVRWNVVAAARRPELLPAAARPERLRLTAWNALEPSALERLLDESRPDAIVVAAALARGDACERDQDLARELNAELPGRAAELARARGLRLVHVSTDLVFGAAPPRGPRYREDEPPSPLSAYGATKAEGEARVLAADATALVVRLPLLWGDSFGRGLGASDALDAALARGEPARLFVDEFRTPLDVANAARAIVELADRTDAGLLHVAGPERLSRFELGRLVCPDGGERLIAARRADLGLAATRPADASLDAALARGRLDTPLLGPTRALHGSALAGAFSGGSSRPA